MKRIIGLILLLLAIAGSVNFVKKISQQSELKLTGNAAYDNGQKIGRVLVPVVLIGIGLLGLSMVFNASQDRPTAPPPPVRRASGTGRPPPGDASLRGGQDTFASNPALLKISAGQWLAANPLVPIMTTSLAFIGLIVVFIKWPPGLVLMITAVIVLFRQIREARQKFYQGDVCPGVVLSAQANLVAVYTNLAASSRVPRPAIKILKQPLRRIKGEPAYDGMRVAAAAFYHGDVRKLSWQNFSPEVIDCVVHDPQQIARVLGSIGEDDWQALDHCLAKVPVKPGLYPLSPASYSPLGGPASAPQSGSEWVPPKPWFKTTPGIIVLCIIGVIVAPILLLKGAVTVVRFTERYHSPSRPPRPPAAPVTPWAAPPGKAGPLTVGSRVYVRWGAGWTPGQITAINSGGFSVMVQFEDRHFFPHPVICSTNQVRLK